MILILESDVFICFCFCLLTELLLKFLHVAKLLNLLGFEPREYARSVSFEKCSECTSQRLKWISGARVVNLVLNALDLTLTKV